MGCTANGPDINQKLAYDQEAVNDAEDALPEDLLQQRQETGDEGLKGLPKVTYEQGDLFGVVSHRHPRQEGQYEL